MAWQTSEDAQSFSCAPQEPDLETLTYWIKRLEPLIRVERTDEIIVVFSNRTGISGEKLFAGTSCVLGITDGEVIVYGMLGRGEKKFLVADTSKPPLGKLIYRPQNYWPDNPLGIQTGTPAAWTCETTLPIPQEPRAITLRRRLPSLTTSFNSPKETSESFLCLSSTDGLTGSCSESHGPTASDPNPGSETDRYAFLELLDAIEKNPEVRYEDQRQNINRPVSPKYRNLGV